MADYDWDFKDYKLEAEKSAVAKALREEYLEMGFEVEVEVPYGRPLTGRVAGNPVCVRCGAVVALRFVQQHLEFLHPYPMA